MTGAMDQPTTGPRAGFGLRLVAAIIDGVLLSVVSLVLGVLGNPGRGLGLLVGLAYYAYLEGGPSGQTVGKRAMNIRIIDAETGGAIGYGRAILRYFAKILSAIPCLLGYFWMLWDKNKQTWHDKIAVDVVVPTSDYPVEAWPG
ncbi:MAG: RDD family protein [Actinobacteria bacterium]|nr:RDD family protein [Actinomycetota bacterium]